MGLPVKKADHKFSYKEYCTWPEDERWELIDGAAYNMSPAPNRFHQGISGVLFNAVYNFLEGEKCRVYNAPFDVRLPDYPEDTDETTFTVVQPDIVVICDQTKLDDAGCRGAPDWIIEIISPASVGKDMKEKLLLYEKHGVKEYWIVHPTDRTVLVYKKTSKGTYGRPDIYTEDDSIKSFALKKFSIEMRKVFSE